MVLILTLLVFAPVKSNAVTKLATPKIQSVTIIDNKYSINYGKVKNAKKYYIYRLNSNKYNKIGTSTLKYFIDKNADVNKNYRYKIKAVNGNKTSKLSSSVKTPNMINKPSINHVSYGGIKYQKFKVYINEQSDATGYYIFRENRKTKNYDCIGKTTTNEFVDENVDISYIQKYKVKAFNNVGRISDFSDETESPTGALKDVNGQNKWKYEDENKSISVVKKNLTTENGNVVCWIAKAKIQNVDDFATEYAGGSWNSSIQTKERTTDMSSKHNAILAINGDASGFMNSNIGRADFMIRNGVPAYEYKTKVNNQNIGCRMNDGTFKIINSKQYSNNQQLLDIGVKDTFYFGLHLIKNGILNEYKENKSLAPRTMIGQKQDSTWLFVVVDGRGCNDSVGMTLCETGKLMKELGAYNAVELDGGGSSTMVFNGYMLNVSSDGCERAVSDCVYIKR